MTREEKVKGRREAAEVKLHFLRQQGASLEAQNTAAELKVRAERKLGVLLKETDLAQGKRNDLVVSLNQVHDKPTLRDLNIEKTQSHRWQTIAELPEADFERHLAETKEQQKECRRDLTKARASPEAALP